MSNIYIASRLKPAEYGKIMGFGGYHANGRTSSLLNQSVYDFHKIKKNELGRRLYWYIIEESIFDEVQSNGVRIIASVDEEIVNTTLDNEWNDYIKNVKPDIYQWDLDIIICKAAKKLYKDIKVTGVHNELIKLDDKKIKYINNFLELEVGYQKSSHIWNFYRHTSYMNYYNLFKGILKKGSYTARQAIELNNSVELYKTILVKHSEFAKSYASI
jgi:hypothetical protein